MCIAGTFLHAPRGAPGLAGRAPACADSILPYHVTASAGFVTAGVVIRAQGSTTLFATLPGLAVLEGTCSIRCLMAAHGHISVDEGADNQPASLALARAWRLNERVMLATTDDSSTVSDQESTLDTAMAEIWRLAADVPALGVKRPAEPRLYLRLMGEVPVAQSNGVDERISPMPPSTC